MAISRPLLVALIGAIIALVAFYAMSGGSESATDSGKPAEPAAEGGSSAARSAPTPDAKAGPAQRRPGSGSARSASPKVTRQGAAAAGTRVPGGVKRALARKRTVVLFFFQRRSADDDATAKSVSALRGTQGVQVFSAPISRLGDYQAVIGGAGVSQAPAIVILGRDRAARLIEGFVDRETLAQQVADAQ